MNDFSRELERIRQSMPYEQPTDLHERLALVRLKAARGRPIRKHKPNLGYVSGKLRRKLVPQKLPMLLRIKAYWPEIIGTKFAKMCEPIKLTGGKLDKVLHIRVIPSLALIIQHEEKAIRERLANMAGGRIQKLKIHQGQINQHIARPPQAATSPPALSQSEKEALRLKLTNISDPKLFAAIEKLGNSVLAIED